MIFQQSGAGHAAESTSLLRLWPFWLVLVVFESVLWLLLALKFRQPCTPVALAVGLTAGLAISSAGGRGLRGGVWAMAITAIVMTMALYGQAAFHVARVLGLPPLQSLIDTGPAFARAVLAGMLGTRDLWVLAGGLALSALFGFGPGARRAPRNRPGTAQRSEGT